MSVVIQACGNYLDLHKKRINPNDSIQTIDLVDFSKTHPHVLEYLLENPAEIETCFQLAWENSTYADLSDIVPQFIIYNVGGGQERDINSMRKGDLNKLISIKGIISSRSGVYPRLKSVNFECPSCGTQMVIIQEDDFFAEPSKCGCGRKEKFKVVQKQFIDCIDLTIEALPESLKPSQTPNSVKAILKGKLTHEDWNLYLGARIEFVGWLSEKQKYILRRKSTIFEFKFNINSYKNLDYVDFDNSISEEEQKIFDEIRKAKNPAAHIRKKCFSDIYGYEKAIESGIIQQFGGRKTPDGRRDTIHILFAGDPGTGKTDIAARCVSLNPINKFVTGTETSSVGLTATVEHDKLSDRWVARAGVIPGTNGGCLVIDEIDKMRDEAKDSLHTAMESGFFTVNKAGISIKMLAETAILSTCNPKVSLNYAKVDENSLNLPPGIIDRKDLVFKFVDLVSKLDEKVATKVIFRDTFDANHDTFDANHDTFDANHDTLLYINIVRKYIYYCKSKNVQYPKMSYRLYKKVSDWYCEVRRQSEYNGYEGKKPTPRLVASVMRFARAIARMKQKSSVDVHHLKLAISYFEYTYNTDQNLAVTKEGVDNDTKTE